MPGLRHTPMEKGLSGHFRPELPVRHTLGPKPDVAYREPLSVKIALRAGIAQ